MDAVPHGLHVGCAEELQIWADALGGAQYRVVGGHLVQGPVHGLAPEAGHGSRIRPVDPYRGDRPGGSVERVQHAELVAAWVGRERPWDVTLASAGGGGAPVAPGAGTLRP